MQEAQVRSPGLWRCSGEGDGYPLQCSCLENLMDRGAWWVTVYGVTKRNDWATFSSVAVEQLKSVHQILSSVYFQVSSVQPLSRVRLFAIPWIAARQASLSITNSRSPPKPMSIESVMPSSHLILCRPLLPLPPTPPSIRLFSNESARPMRWPKYWSFIFSISPSNELTSF